MKSFLKMPHLYSVRNESAERARQAERETQKLPINSGFMTINHYCELIHISQERHTSASRSRRSCCAAVVARLRAGDASFAIDGRVFGYLPSKINSVSVPRGKRDPRKPHKRTANIVRDAAAGKREEAGATIDPERSCDNLPAIRSIPWAKARETRE